MKKIYTLLLTLSLLTLGTEGVLARSGTASHRNSATQMGPREKAVRTAPAPQVQAETRASITRAEKPADWDQLSTQEKKEWKQEMKSTLKAARKEAAPQGDSVILAVLLAILIPPLGVWYWEGSIGTNFWIDLILTLLFWLPGMIFAFLVIAGVV